LTGWQELKACRLYSGYIFRGSMAYREIKSKDKMSIGQKFEKERGKQCMEAWEVKLPATEKSHGDDPQKAFYPTSGAERAQPHMKGSERDR